MSQNENVAQGVWVRLHLERQSESSFMPPYVEGFLTKETDRAYVLTKVMQERENPETFDIEYVEAVEHHHVSRTYVWNCQVLGSRPVAPAYSGGGGLG
jgi:hypothetical protein